jgi:hypothetical protein
MENIQFIRMESPEDGYGIFTSTKNDINRRWSICLSMDHEVSQQIYSNHNRFPSPYEEGFNLHKTSNECFCGFKSLEQVSEWFTREQIKYIISNGIRIYAITGKPTFIGKFQIIFEKENIISKEDITELFQ